MLRIAVGDMCDEVDEVAEGDNAIFCRGGRRLEEDFALVLILAVLAFEVVFVGAVSMVSEGFVERQRNMKYLRRVSSDFVLEIRPIGADQ